MAFVEIIFGQNTVVLRAQSSELLILPLHAIELKKISDPTQFSQYFINHALVNRPARKLFEAWLRKDMSIWPRLYRCVHDKVQLVEDKNPFDTLTEFEPQAEKTQQTTENSVILEDKLKPTPKAKLAKPKKEADTPKKTSEPKKKTSTTIATKAKATSKTSETSSKSKKKAPSKTK